MTCMTISNGLDEKLIKEDGQPDNDRVTITFVLQYREHVTPLKPMPTEHQMTILRRYVYE